MYFIAGSRKLLAALLAAGVCYAIAPASSGAASPVRDPHGIACPGAPSGWTIAPGDSDTTPGGGRTILDPFADPTHRLGSSVNISCDYFAGEGVKHIVVELSYALPTDFNPHNDFFFGCQSGGTKWTDADRIYRTMSPTQWAIAVFTDFLGALGPKDVPVWVNVTDQLLHNAEGYAHSCKLKLQPTAVIEPIAYNFTSDAGEGKGSFAVSGTVGKIGSAPVVKVAADSLKLHFEGHALTVRVTRGVSFYPPRPKQTARAVLSVEVTQSGVASCATGNTGTLTLTPASLSIRVCSQTFSGGKTALTFIAV